VSVEDFFQGGCAQQSVGIRIQGGLIRSLELTENRRVQGAKPALKQPLQGPPLAKGPTLLDPLLDPLLACFTSEFFSNGHEIWLDLREEGTERLRADVEPELRFATSGARRQWASSSSQLVTVATRRNQESRVP